MKYISKEFIKTWLRCSVYLFVGGYLMASFIDWSIYPNDEMFISFWQKARIGIVTCLGGGCGLALLTKTLKEGMRENG